MVLTVVCTIFKTIYACQLLVLATLTLFGLISIKFMKLDSPMIFVKKVKA